MKKKVSTLHRLNYRHLIEVLVILLPIVTLSFFLRIYMAAKQEEQRVNKAYQEAMMRQSQVRMTSPTPELLSTEVQPHSLLYRSQSLGLQFHYLSQIGSQFFFVREIGNTIYLYHSLKSSLPFSGTDDEFLKSFDSHMISAKWLQVFSKDTTTSLAETVQHIFLNGKSSNDCFVTAIHAPIVYHPTYERVFIDYPRSNKDLPPELAKRAVKCSPYARVASVGYFMMDSLFPSKFYYLDLGQDNIQSGLPDGSAWSDTIEAI